MAIASTASTTAAILSTRSCRSRRFIRAYIDSSSSGIASLLETRRHNGDYSRRGGRLLLDMVRCLVNHLIVNGVFKALSDPTRAAVLQLLREGPKTAGELAEHFPVSQADHVGALRRVARSRPGPRRQARRRRSSIDSRFGRSRRRCWSSRSSSGSTSLRRRGSHLVPPSQGAL